MEGRISGLLKERGPLTGAELKEALGRDGFALWKTCMLSSRLAVRRVGRRCLRLDQKVEGFARLSPSILREFLTCSVVGPADDCAALDRRTEDLTRRIRDISAAKLRLAQRVAADIGAGLLEDEGGEEERFCVLLAGGTSRVRHVQEHGAVRDPRRGCAALWQPRAA